MNITKVLSSKHPAVRVCGSNIGCRIPSVVTRTAAVRRISSVAHIRGKRSGIIVCGNSKKLSESSAIISNTGIRIENSNIIAESMISERIRIMGDISYE